MEHSIRSRSKPIIREHTIPTPDSKPYIAVEGPDGNLWFCESGASKIGCFDTFSCTFREFDLPSADSTPIGIDVGADGNLWFTEKTGNRIGRLSRSGVITEFALPTAAAGPDGIALGPDGNIWFSAADIDRLGCVTPDGRITERWKGHNTWKSAALHRCARWSALVQRGSGRARRSNDNRRRRH